MRKTEFNFFVNIKSGPRTPLDIEVSYNEGGVKKSMFIFGKERSKRAIAALLSYIVKSDFVGSISGINAWLDKYEKENE